MGRENNWTFTNFELAKHNRNLSRKLRYEKLLQLATCARIVQLKFNHMTPRELARDVFAKHNVTRFLH